LLLNRSQWEKLLGYVLLVGCWVERLMDVGGSGSARCLDCGRSRWSWLGRKGELSGSWLVLRWVCWLECGSAAIGVGSVMDTGAWLDCGQMQMGLGVMDLGGGWTDDADGGTCRWIGRLAWGLACCRRVMGAVAGVDGFGSRGCRTKMGKMDF
ncbi:hypothetical protein ACLOJK_038567, partial [Asimina triloba]